MSVGTAESVVTMDSKLDSKLARNSFSGRSVETPTEFRQKWRWVLLSIFTIHMVKITKNGANLVISAYA
jgi:hypothetical protein